MNRLEHLKEFQDILANYEISEASRKTLREISLVLLTAPTSSGRNTVINELLKTGDYYFIISDTTRKPRVNNGVLEENGGPYWFRDEREVLEDLRAGKFLEAEIIHGQQVSGMSIRELDKARAEDKIAITDVDIGGVQNVITAKPDALAILMLPPGFEEWQRRIRTRGEMDDEEFRRRMETACVILANALEHDYFTFVINDKLEDTINEIHQLARFGIKNEEAQAHARDLAEQLYIETKTLLKSL